MSNFRKQTQLQTHQAKLNEAQMADTPNLTGMVSTLAAFSGMGMNAISNRLDEKVQEDSVRQMERVSQGMLPTDDATRGGYKAGAVLGMKLEGERRRARLKELAADPNLSTEDWQKALANEHTASKEYLQQNYTEMQTDPSLNKAVAMDMIDDIPQLTAAREVTRLKAENAQRQNDFKDFIMTQHNSKDFNTNFEALSGSLKISPQVATKMLVDSAIESGDVGFMENVANKSDGEHLLGEVNPQLQRALKQKRAEVARQNAGEIADQKAELLNQLESGDMNGQQFNDYVSKRNEETGGAFMTPSQAFSMKQDAYKNRSAANRLETNSQAILTGGAVRNMSTKDKQSAGLNAYSVAYQDALAALPEDQRNTAQGQMLAQSRAVQRTAESLNRSGIVLDSWKTELTSTSRTNPDMVIVKGADGSESITPEFQAKLNLYTSLPEPQRSLYAKGDTAKILNNYERYVKQGVAPAQAIRQAQMSIHKLDYKTQGALYESAKQATDDAFTKWFDGKDDIPQNQRAYVESKMQEYISDQFTDYDSDDARESAVKWAKENMTQLADGRVLVGNANELSAAFNVDKDQISNVMDWALDNRSQVIQDKLKWVGGDIKDAHWDIDQNTGRATLMSVYGTPIAGTTVSLKELGDEYRVEYNKRLRESKVSTAKKQKEGLNDVTTHGQYNSTMAVSNFWNSFLYES